MRKNDAAPLGDWIATTIREPCDCRTAYFRRRLRLAKQGSRAPPYQRLFGAGDWGDAAVRLKAAQWLITELAKMAGGAAVKPAEVKVAAKVARAAPKPMPPRPSEFRAKGRG